MAVALTSVGVWCGRKGAKGTDALDVGLVHHPIRRGVVKIPGSIDGGSAIVGVETAEEEEQQREGSQDKISALHRLARHYDSTRSACSALTTR